MLSMQQTQDKATLRKRYREIRAALHADGSAAAADARIAEAVCNTEAYQHADTILLYAATPQEVDTSLIARAALRDGKRLAYPVCDVARHCMDFYAVTSDTALHAAAYGILEPPAIPAQLVQPSPDTLCIVPGLAFDGLGNRLGYGGGYYDRFLAAYPVLKTIGICYAACLAASLPAEKTDQRVQQVFTETKSENHMEVGHGRKFQEYKAI